MMTYLEAGRNREHVKIPLPAGGIVPSYWLHKEHTLVFSEYPVGGFVFDNHSITFEGRRAVI
jgi:hypothetical protein